MCAKHIFYGGSGPYGNILISVGSGNYLTTETNYPIMSQLQMYKGAL